ncbi:class II aldolase/adducin family protein [uncultured Ruegeria sp.]|uniref:class II aldolase/adducin family protein n=1 Tax=uncultured Ruegeria sp. TaxID=259304 RepID=UPI0026269060|nr:class II aldolase/adducin family protein [uncultured Ruegeria sp.]
MDDPTLKKRQAIIDHCLLMNSSGLNQGTSGNISIRHDDGMLISPTSIPYSDLTPDKIASVHLDGRAEGPIAPSSEWRFHRDVFVARPEVNAIVHAHPTYCTVLAIHGREIPSVHYMMAIFGGPNVRCAPYAIYGSQDLSDHAVTALEDRHACLLEHHGSIALGRDIAQAYWRAEELETLARQYHGALMLGDPPLLSNRQIQDVIDKIADYGLSDEDTK